MIEIDKYVDFITEHKLSEHQFLILWLINAKDGKNIAKYRKTFDTFNTDEIKELITRGWIDDFGLVEDNIRTYNIYDFIVTNKFTETVYIDSFDAGDELIDTYPNWVMIKNIRVSAKSCDHDELISLYGKILKNNRNKHNDIIRLVQSMKELHNGYAPMGIEKFVKSRHWTILEEDNNLNNKDMISDR
jgi:hypothetical protein